MILFHRGVCRPLHLLLPVFLLLAGVLCEGQEAPPAAKLAKPEMAQSDKDFLLDLARATIGQAIQNREATTPEAKTPPEEKGTSTRVVVVTLFSQGRLLHTATAQEDSLANSVRKAAWKVGETIRQFQDASAALKSGRILIDIVGERTRIPTNHPREALRSINLGVEGIEVNVKGAGAFVPPIPMMVNLSMHQSVVDQLFTLAGATGAAKTPAEVEFLKFPTVSFIESAPGAAPVDLYRGNILISKLDSEDLETAAFAGGRWLLKMQDPSGKFLHYWFHPMTQVQEPRYDMAHHAAACLAFLELYERTHDEGFRLALKRGRDHLLQQVKHLQRGGRRVAYVEVANDGPLGVSALALLLLAEWARVFGEKPDVQMMDDLGAFVCSMQAESGAFYRQLSHVEKKALPSEDQPTFFAGQSIYALCRANKIVPHDEWIEVAVKGAGFQTAEFVKSTSPDPWVMRGLAELYELTQDDSVAKTCLQMANVILAHQHLPGSVPDADFIGGFDDANPPRTAAAARFVQGLSAAHAMARKLGKPTDRYRQAMNLAMKFVLQQQLRPENSYFIVNLPQALGGFHQNPMLFDLRIDYTQQAVTAAMDMADILREK